jgi:anti-sigma factor (TIGR02949 family)
MAGDERFNCDQVLARLDDYLDRTLSAPEVQRVEAHLEECLACLHAYRYEASLFEGIRARLRRLAIPAGLLALVRLRLDAAARGRD